jgi:hypothetical protein
MKRSVGALDSCASSTRAMTLEMVLSAAAAATRTLMAVSVLMVPAKTVSPTPLLLGTLSPVTGASSMAPRPSTIAPSAGMRSPGRTSTTCFRARLDAWTSRTPSPSTSSAVLGTRSARPLMLARARPAAKPSSISPTRKSRTTVAASSVAPMTTAPMAAIDISVSMENGLPAMAPATARRPIGTKPTSSATRNAQCPTSGTTRPTR